MTTARACHSELRPTGSSVCRDSELERLTGQLVQAIRFSPVGHDSGGTDVDKLEQIRDQQQAIWDKFSAGWRKWDGLVLDWLAPVGMELLDSARLRPDAYVLDIASGTGEPALSAAARCPHGKVMMTDLAEQDAPRRQGERRAAWSPQC